MSQGRRRDAAIEVDRYWGAVADLTLRAIFDLTGVLVAMLDEQDRICHTNQALRDLLGFSGEDLEGMRHADILHDAQHESYADQRKALLDGNIPLCRFEANYMTKDGRSVWADLSFASLRDAGGRVIGLLSAGQDITDRRRTAQALQESEEKYRRIVDTALDGVWTVDENFNTSFVNGRMAEMLGYSVEGMIGRPLKDFYWPDQSADDFENRKRRRRQGIPENYEQCLRHKEGRRVWTRISATPVFDGGQFAGSFAMLTDVTVEKRMAEAVRQSEVLFQTVFEESSVGIAVAASDGRLMRSNRALCKMLGYTHEEMAGLTVEDITHPEDMPGELLRLQQVFSGAAKGYELEKRYVRKDGGIVWGKLTANSVRNPEDKVLFGVGIVEDVTLQREVEERLKLTEFAVDSASTSVFWINPEGRFLYVNKAACEKLGWSKEELQTMTVADVDAKETADQRPQLWEELKRCGVRTFESDHRTKSGRTIPVEIASNYLVFGGKEYECAFAVDISDRKAAERESRNYQDKLRLLATKISETDARERSRLASELHDYVAQNLAFCKMKLGMAGQARSEKERAALTREVEGFLEQTLSEVRSLIFQLSPPVLEELGFIPGLQWLADDMNRKHGLEVRIDVDPSWRDLESGCEEVLFSCVRELLINVVKHAGTGCAWVNLQRDGDRAEIEVRDNGAGFDVSEASGVQGEHFGLFNIRERLRTVNGRLECSSAPGEGSSLRIIVDLRK